MVKTPENDMHVVKTVKENLQKSNKVSCFQISLLTLSRAGFLPKLSEEQTMWVVLRGKLLYASYTE